MRRIPYKLPKIQLKFPGSRPNPKLSSSWDRLGQSTVSIQHTSLSGRKTPVVSLGATLHGTASKKCRQPAQPSARNNVECWICLLGVWASLLTG